MPPVNHYQRVLGHEYFLFYFGVGSYLISMVHNNSNFNGWTQVPTIMIIDLKRFAYLSNCTRGVLQIGVDTFQTIERPWVPLLDGPGGTPFESCIPDGDYRLRAFTRPSGKKAFILSNPEHGVYELDEDRVGGKGRYLILIHPGNTVDDVVGCIAPGLHGEDRVVGSSRLAMYKIIQLLEGFEHTIRISPKGAV